MYSACGIVAGWSLAVGIEMKNKTLNLRLLLRSVYLKGHQDVNMKTTDLSWEDKIVRDIKNLFEERTER